VLGKIEEKKFSRKTDFRDLKNWARKCFWENKSLGIS
jgi:hypothetical protein